MDGSKDRAKPLTQAERRQLRLEQQLRANLQKRKGQARARREDNGTSSTAENGAGEAALDLPPGPRSD